MRIMPTLSAALAAATLCAPAALPQSSGNALRPPSAFASIADRAARSRALFAEAAKVFTSPRCINCHPPAIIPPRATTARSTIRRSGAAPRATASRARPARPAT